MSEKRSDNRRPQDGRSGGPRGGKGKGAPRRGGGRADASGGKGKGGPRSGGKGGASARFGGDRASSRPGGKGKAPARSGGPRSGGERSGAPRGSWNGKRGAQPRRDGERPVRGRRGEGAQAERRDDGARPARFERDGKRSSRFAAKAPHGDAPASPNHKAPRDGKRGPARSDAAGTRTPSGYAGRPDRPRPLRTKATPARLAALAALREVRERKAYAQDVIARDIDDSSLTPEDRAFATRLVLGVVSSTGTLDEVIDRVLDDPHDVSPQVRDALRISTYEIFFLDKRFHAAVDQGVELVKSVAPPAAGLTNYVLRQLVRLRAEFPFADPNRDIEALARLHAFPAWQAALLMNDLGPEAAFEFMRASNEPAPLFVAVNAAKTRDELVLRAFERVGEQVERVEIEGSEVPGCLRLDDPRTLLLPDVKRLLSQGRILVSDAASQQVAASVLPEKKPASFLEVGAGRATKTILIQSGALRRWGAQIEEYVALDNRAFKKKVLEERVERFGIHVSEALVGDVLDADELMPGRSFDAVFLDAPCSGLGTLRRHPEIRWRLKPDEIVDMARQQVAMLRALASHVNPGGTLAYATCTVTRMENDAVVKAFLKTEEGSRFHLAPIAGKPCVSTRLSKGSPDAHFAVRFVRADDTGGADDVDDGGAGDDGDASRS